MDMGLVDQTERRKVKRRYATIYLLTEPTGRSKLGTSRKSSKGHYQRISGSAAKTFWGMALSCQYDICLGECDADVATKNMRIYELILLLVFVNQLLDANHEVSQPCLIF